VGTRRCSPALVRLSKAVAFLRFPPASRFCQRLLCVTGPRISPRNPEDIPIHSHTDATPRTCCGPWAAPDEQLARFDYELAVHASSMIPAPSPATITRRIRRDVRRASLDHSIFRREHQGRRHPHRPRLTRMKFPGNRLRLNKVTNLADDLALNPARADSPLRVPRRRNTFGIYYSNEIRRRCGSRNWSRSLSATPKVAKYNFRSSSARMSKAGAGLDWLLMPPVLIAAATVPVQSVC